MGDAMVDGVNGDDWPTVEDIHAFDWAAMTPDVSRGWFAAPSGKLATAEWGPPDGVPVLALPGITGSKEDFALVGPILARAGYHVVSADLAGQYESHAAGPAPGGHFDLALHVADAEVLLAAHGPAHVIGYSFAGEVAQQLVHRHPDQVRSLTLISTPPMPGNALAKVRIIGLLAHAISPKMAAGLMRWGIMRNINRMPANRVAFVRRRFESTVLSSMTDAMAAMMRVPDVEAALRGSGVPVLVAVGHGDLWTAKQHRALAERINAQVHEYPTGHAPMETRPKELAADLSAFYATVDGAGRAPGPTGPSS
jgi:pimeloyl-ACP methyl ester carboxylesterase